MLIVGDGSSTLIAGRTTDIGQRDQYKYIIGSGLISS